MTLGATRPKPKTVNVLVGAALVCLSFGMAVEADELGRKDTIQKTRTVSYNLEDYGVVSMADAVQRISQDVGGMVVDIRLETPRNPNDWTYRSKVLLPDGRVMFYVHDPKTLDVLSQDTQF